MRFRPGFAAFCALASSLTAYSPAAAQLMQLRNSVAVDRFKVDTAGGVLAVGTTGRGTIPATGSGVRMMWYPNEAAFRAGQVSGTHWDEANVGPNSAAFGYNATASGGNSFATASYSTASGSSSQALGSYTTASGFGAVAIGYRSEATASYSTAIGQMAAANHFGAIVIGDGSTTSDSVRSTANYQFVVRAHGGYRLFTNFTLTAGVSLTTGGTSWDVISDRNRKHRFLAVDGEDLLARLRRVPVTTWRLTTEADTTVRHIGPMAQDWRAAFGFRQDSTTINLSDFDGVNLAGVKALEERTRQQQALIRALEERTREQEARIQALSQELAGLRAVQRDVADLRRLLLAQTGSASQ